LLSLSVSPNAPGYPILSSLCAKSGPFRIVPLVGINIILARLVNHAELMVLGGGRVGDNLIQLSQFQRSGIVLVLHADDESWLWLSRSHSSGYRMSVSLAED